jgi:MFS family permease
MKFPVWLIALSATMLAQTISSFMGQCLPVVAPLLTASSGVAPERIGNLSSLTSLGSVIFLAFGSPYLARFGPVRSLQLGSAAAIVAMAVAAFGWWPALVASSLLLGLSYGPTPPSGSRILAATAPKEHRSLIFSIKQAGAPAGGALAGLIIAPVAVAFGWTTALLLAVAAGAITIVALNPLRAMMDVERDRNRSIHPRDVFRLATVLAPIKTLRAAPMMIPLTFLAFSFSCTQGTLYSFSVTYLTQRGLALTDAGFAYACLQSAGVFARILLGWFADRTGKPAMNLTIQAYIAAGCVLLYAFMPLDLPLGVVALIATACGFFGASWNGIYMAEIARLAPPENVADATSASTLFTFLGYVIAPSLFALAVPSWGWRWPYAMVALQLTLMAMVQTFLLIRSSRRASPAR